MKKKKDQRKRGPTKKILSSETSPLWMSLGLPSSGPQKIDLHCRSQSLDQMPTLYVVSDAMNLLLVLARRAKQKRDGEALLNLVLAAKTINGLLKSLERTHRELFNFAAELSEWPMNLAPKQQMVDAAVARLVRLRVGTHSAPPTWRGVQIESGNWATRIAAELIRQLEAFRSQQRAANNVSLPPLLADLNKSRIAELVEMPDTCSDLWKLEPLGSRTWEVWWQYALPVLKSLWKQHPALYAECVNHSSAAEEMKNKQPESIRRNYAKRHIKQAFASIAKNLRKP